MQQALIPLARVATSQVKMEGLLGNNDNIKENDMKPKDKTEHLTLNPDTDGKRIHNEFGETCKWRSFLVITQISWIQTNDVQI